MPRHRAPETFPCPVCGEEVSVGAPGCRECGSNEETGWSAETEYDGLDLPDPPGSSFEEDSTRSPRIPRWALVLIIAATAATLLVSMW